MGMCVPCYTLGRSKDNFQESVFFFHSGLQGSNPGFRLVQKHVDPPACLTGSSLSRGIHNCSSPQWRASTLSSSTVVGGSTRDPGTNAASTLGPSWGLTWIGDSSLRPAFDPCRLRCWEFHYFTHPLIRTSGCLGLDIGGQHDSSPGTVCYCLIKSAPDSNGIVKSERPQGSSSIVNKCWYIQIFFVSEADDILVFSISTDRLL